MRCLQCGKKLGLLRQMRNGEFCSAEHQELYKRSESQMALVRLQESQVRIERPTPASAAAALAAVERLRAMDASASDPVFVETFQFPEKIFPRNSRRMAAPEIGPLVAERGGLLPERTIPWGSPSPQAGGPSPCRVEPAAMRRPEVQRVLGLRPQFRLGVRLLTSGCDQRAGQLRQAGLSRLTLPRPRLRAGRIRAGGAESGRWLKPKPVAPALPSQYRTVGAECLEDRLRRVLPLEVDAILPAAKKSSAQAGWRQGDLAPMGAEGAAALHGTLRTAAGVDPLSERGLSGETREHVSCPAEPVQLAGIEPVSVRTAQASVSPPRSTPAAALACDLDQRLPSLWGAAPAAPLMVSGEDLEAVQLRVLNVASGVCLRARPLTPETAETAPSLRYQPVSRIRSDEAMQPVGVFPAPGALHRLGIAVEAEAETAPPALPGPGDPWRGTAGMQRGSLMLTVGPPDAETGRMVCHEAGAAPLSSLGAELPAHAEVHTTLPRMREETRMRAIEPQPAVAGAPAPANSRPLSMSAAAAASGPAMPEFTAPADGTGACGAAPASVPAMVEAESSVAVTETMEASGEPAPPELNRQLPLALGRPVGSIVAGHRTPVGGYAPAWQDSVDHPPAAPTARLKTDHADGSGSRQGRGSQVVAPRRPLLPPIDLRSLPGRKFWTYAPADLKWVALGLPLILVFVVYSFRGTQPKTETGLVTAIQQPASEPATSTQAAAGPSATAQPAAPGAGSASVTGSLKQVLVNRAAVNLLDDFRGGLGAWQGNEGWAKTWRYGQATFLEPGNLALFKPSLALRDYSLEFLGQIQSQSLNWVFRAKDLKNYYAIRLVVKGNGPMPNAQVIQYAVINGKEDRPKVMPTPYPVRPDTMYLVRVDVHGSDFNIYLQGQPMYSFTDDRLPEGGVGFFGPKGDKSYLRWVQVKHQYDYIGRLCALLAPYQVQPEAGKTE